MEMWVLFGVFTLLLLIGTPVAFCLGEAGVDRDRAAQVRRKPGEELDLLGAELAFPRRAEHANVRHRAALAARGAQADEGAQALGPQALVVERGAQELGLRHHAFVGHHAADRERCRTHRQLVASCMALQVVGHASGVDADLHDPARAVRPDDAEHGGGAAEQPREVGQDPVPAAEARGRVVGAVDHSIERLTVGRHGDHPRVRGVSCYTNSG